MHIFGDLDWKLVNTYFVAALPNSGINNSNINDTMYTINLTIYEYFRENFGTLRDVNTLHLIDKCKGCKGCDFLFNRFAGR